MNKEEFRKQIYEPYVEYSNKLRTGTRKEVLKTATGREYKVTIVRILYIVGCLSFVLLGTVGLACIEKRFDFEAIFLDVLILLLLLGIILFTFHAFNKSLEELLFSDGIFEIKQKIIDDSDNRRYLKIKYYCRVFLKEKMKQDFEFYGNTNELKGTSVPLTDSRLDKLINHIFGNGSTCETQMQSDIRTMCMSHLYYLGDSDALYDFYVGRVSREIKAMQSQWINASCEERRKEISEKLKKEAEEKERKENLKKQIEDAVGFEFKPSNYTPPFIDLHSHGKTFWNCDYCGSANEEESLVCVHCYAPRFHHTKNVS